MHDMGRPGCEVSGIVLPSSLEPDDIVLIGVGMIDSLRVMPIWIDSRMRWGKRWLRSHPIVSSC